LIGVQSNNPEILPVPGLPSRTARAVPAIGGLAVRARFRRACKSGNCPLMSARAAPYRLPGAPRICGKQSKEQWKMKWFKKVAQPEREPLPKPASEEKAPPQTRRIEEREARITPNAIWGD
jgi:hypothetical protein